MKTFLPAAMLGAAIACLAAPATAADLAGRMHTKAPAVSPLYDWSGFYVGAHVGYAWGDEHDDLSITTQLLGDKFAVSGALGGVHLGYNWQSGQFLFGLEGDADASNVKGSITPTTTAGSFRTTGTLSFRNDWQASFRARAGITVDRALFYVTGGVAFAGVNSGLDISRGIYTGCEGICVFNNVSSSGSATLTGWTIGGGAEYAFARNWIARAEVRYTDFGSKTLTFADTATTTVPTKVRFDQTNTSIGISYKF